MPVTAATNPMMGGTYGAGGPAKGQYHCIVNDAQITEAKTGRLQLVTEFFVRDDPNHPAKQNKKLTKWWQCFPMPDDDAEKAKNMRGMWKRLVYDGFGMKWPDSEKPFDPRVLIGKTAWVLMGDTKGADGQPRVGVVAVAQTQEGLPLPKNGATDMAAAAVAGAAPSRVMGGRARR
jgi:hypothetical protein